MWGRIVQWFKGLSPVGKAMATIAILVGSVAASPLVVLVATVMFMVGLLALEVRSFEGRPLKGWAVATGVFFALIVVGSGVSEALYRDACSQETAGGPPKQLDNRTVVQEQDAEAKGGAPTCGSAAPS
jgi:hypothetical protein